MQTAVNHPDEISTLFDPSIVYAKGARLLFMAYNLNQPWSSGEAWGMIDESFDHDSYKVQAIRDWLASH